MIRKRLESRTGPLTDPEFRRIMVLLTRDIQEYHIRSGQRTSLHYVVQIATLTHSLILKRKRRFQGRPPKGAVPRTARARLEGVM